MNLVSIIPQYITWHYTKSMKDFLSLWSRLFWFVAFFFSFKDLFKTFFSPFARLNETYKKGFNLGDFMSTLVVNILMRIVGVLIRTCIILLGLISFILAAVLGAVLFIIWITLPLGIAYLVFMGIKILIPAITSL